MASRLAQKDLAALLGLSTRQVRNLVDAGMPVVSEGGKLWYDGPACVAWYVGEKERQAKEKDADDAGETKALRLERLRLEVDAARMANASQRGALVPAVDVQAAAEDEATRVAGVLSQLPSEFAPLVAARLGVNLRQAAAVLREVSDAVRARLASADDEPEQVKVA